jgi:hypothetical protein
VMLDVWTKSGWVDPVLTPAALEGMRAGRRVVWSGPQGALVSLEPE